MYLKNIAIVLALLFSFISGYFYSHYVISEKLDEHVYFMSALNAKNYLVLLNSQDDCTCEALNKLLERFLETEYRVLLSYSYQEEYNNNEYISGVIEEIIEYKDTTIE